MHYADVIEGYADRAPDAIALVHGETRRTWAEFEDRAARLAGALEGAGLGPGSKVGLLLYNGPEYYEAFLAALKARMVPININYRYVDDELVYLLEDSDAEALVFHASLGETVGRVAERVPALKLLAEVDDGPSAGAGAKRYEDILARSEAAPRIDRRHDDDVMIYTGGTTGMPKGVVYDVGDWTDGLLGLASVVLGIPPLPDDVEELVAAGVERIAAGAAPAVMPCSPLMHTAGLGNSVAVQLAGGRAVTLPGRSLDPDEIWSTVERESVNVMIIVGDAFARPMLTALEDKAAAGDRWDLGSLGVIMSSGVMWSAPIKQGLLEHVDTALIDGIGATEGAMGVQVSRRGDPPAQTGKFLRLGETKLFSEDGREIEPGSDEPGMIAAGGKLTPKCYYKDPRVGPRVPRDRRAALRIHRRLGPPGGRRNSCAARPGVGVHQYRRREGVPRGGRRGHQDPPRCRRRSRTRHSRRALRPTGDRGGRARRRGYRRRGRDQRVPQGAARRIQATARRRPGRRNQARRQRKTRLPMGARCRAQRSRAGGLAGLIVDSRRRSACHTGTMSASGRASSCRRRLPPVAITTTIPRDNGIATLQLNSTRTPRFLLLFASDSAVDREQVPTGRRTGRGNRR